MSRRSISGVTAGGTLSSTQKSALMPGPPVTPAARLELPGGAATPPAPLLLLLAADFSVPSSEGLTDPAADAAVEAGAEGDAAAGTEADAAAEAEAGAAADVASAADGLWTSAASGLGGGILMAREPMPLGALPTAKWDAREMAAWEAA